MANAVVRQIPHPLCGDRYRIDFDALEAAVTPRTRLLLYTSPSNPLGWVATEEEQQGLLDFARRHGLWLLADEVYDRLYYAGARLGDPVPSILRMATRDDAVMVVHSFSKSYCMTGWRVGWLVARRDLAAKATQLNEFIISHAPSFAQKAAETALAEGEEELARMLARLKENRDLCLDALRGIAGVTVPKPDGAFYLFPRSMACTDSFEFLPAAAGGDAVGLAPGVAFGAGGEGSIRICYAAERSILEPAMERLNRISTERIMIRGFKEFLLKNNVLALAVAVIVGGAVGKVVSSLAADIMMPLISIVLPSGDWRAAKFVLSRTVGPDGKEVVNAVNYGTFFGNVVDFLIIAFVVYMMTKALIKEAPAAPPSKTCPRCKEAIVVDASRCKFCTADI